MPTETETREQRARERRTIRDHLRTGLELPGRLEISWAMGGGIVGGGPLVASVLMSGQASSSMLLTMTTLLFLIGGGLGLVHGALLGYLGRDTEMSSLEALESLVVGVFLAIPALVFAWLVAAWIAMTAPALSMGEAMVVGIVAAGWVVGAAICCWGAWQGWQALQNILDRWPAHRPGVVILAVVLVFLLVSFLSWQPEVWGTDMRVTGVGALLLAIGATIWIAAPITALALWLLRIRTGLEDEANGEMV